LNEFTNDKSTKIFKARDILVFVFIFVLSMIFFIYFDSLSFSDYVIVEIDGNEEYIIDINRNCVLDIEHSGNLLMKLKVVNKKVWIYDSSCALKICEKHGPLAFPTDAIVCVPNHVIVRYKEKELNFENNSFDIMTQ